MNKKYIISILTIFLIILTGCQSQTNLHEDAEDIYLSIENEVSTNKRITDSQQDQINDFKNKYILNYENYESDKELLSDMDKLISNYQLYYVAIGQNDEEAVKKYRDHLNESLSNLDKQFNK